ncbi:MAG TPA: PIN domain-containing protein [Gemmatimonadota bacterium]|nr:PIN domain-containing protein [Gemmatimonadota bacterium]
MARVFVDTSALYATLVRDDENHPAANGALQLLKERGMTLVTSSYVVHETIALLQRRWGIEAVRDWERNVEGGLVIVWVDAEVHDHAMGALLAAADRAISLTDWASFEIMRREGIDRAFAFDRDFENRGFEVIPAPA